MIKWFKNIVIAATTLTSATTVSCTITRKKEPEQPKLNSIDVILPKSKILVQENSEVTTNPILVNCYDQNGNKLEQETVNILTTIDGQTPPEWIYINSENMIHVDGALPEATVDFVLYVQEKSGEIKSKPQYFSVEFFKKPLYAPDTIEIIPERELKEVSYSGTDKVNFSINSFYEEYPQELISRDCNWTISKIIGSKSTDLVGNDLFQLKSTDKDCQLIVSSATDESYIGKYILTIKAISKLEPYAQDECGIEIHIVDGFKYYDEFTKITYTRESLDETWTLSLLDPSVVYINKMEDEIYEVPVTKVASNLLSKSGVAKLTSLYLSPNVNYVGDYAFYDQKYLFNFSCPGLKYVGESAFEGCVSLFLVSTSDQPKLDVVKNRAFYNCSSFSLDSENTFTEIGDYAFCNTKLSNINLGKSITKMGNEIFSGCSKLSTIVVETETPPKLFGPLYSGSIPLKTIKIPSSGVENYKKAAIWSIYSTKFVGF